MGGGVNGLVVDTPRAFSILGNSNGISLPTRAAIAQLDGTAAPMAPPGLGARAAVIPPPAPPNGGYRGPLNAQEAAAAGNPQVMALLRARAGQLGAQAAKQPPPLMPQ